MMRFLHISGHRTLARARCQYLSALGFDVVDARMRSALDILNSNQKFDAAILCHTLSGDEKLRIADTVRARWAVPMVLELYLAESPVTRGIALEADTEFQPWMVRWAASPPAIYAQTVDMTSSNEMPEASAQQPEPKDCSH